MFASMSEGEAEEWWPADEPGRVVKNQEKHACHVCHTVIEDEPVQPGLLFLVDDQGSDTVDKEVEEEDGKAGEDVHIRFGLVDLF